MTKFLVSARKYRPQTFGELISQDHVGESMRNAIKLDRLAHAYLFCGPRGVGKTSAARILAKTVNCSTPLDDRPDVEPCRKCDSCVAFEEGRSLNVIEIDAASNNSVDDIRALRETVRVPPQIGTKKVYIIDEVHMLSKQAFNALLKTLEEPPSYVQFLFATTEPQKVIPTILSRCQRFDFRRISIPDIVKQLRAICDEQGIQADEASLRLVARKGDGSMRDAFSTFDQAVLLCGNNLEYSSLVKALGTVDVDVYFETAELIAAHDKAGLLILVNDLVNKGYDIHEYLLGLTDHFRSILVAMTTGSTDLIEADPETAERYSEQGPLFSEMDLLRHLIVVDETLDVLRRSVKPRLRLELALLKMASLAKSADLQQILQHLTKEGSSDTQNKSASTVKTGASTPAPKLSPPSSTERKNQDVTPPALAATPVPAAPTPAAAPVLVSLPAPVVDRKTPVTAEIDLASVPREKASSTENFFGSPAITAPPARIRLAAVPDSVPEDELTSAPNEAIIPFSSIETAWDSYITSVMKDRIHVGALLQHASPSSIVGSTIEIAVPDVFHEKLLGSETVYLADKLATTLSLSPPPSVRVVVSETDTIPDVVPEMNVGERIQKLKEQNPIIAALVDNFGGEVVW